MDFQQPLCWLDEEFTVIVSLELLDRYANQSIYQPHLPLAGISRPQSRQAIDDDVLKMLAESVMCFFRIERRVDGIQPPERLQCSVEAACDERCLNAAERTTRGVLLNPTLLHVAH